MDSTEDTANGVSTEAQESVQKRKRAVVLVVNSRKKRTLVEEEPVKNFELAPLDPNLTVKQRETRLADEEEDLRLLRELRMLPERRPIQPLNSPNRAPHPTREPFILNPERDKTDEAVALSDIFLDVFKEHQFQGVRFLWRTVIQEAGGCVLAHAMGLGKTAQTIAFLYTLAVKARDGLPLPTTLQPGMGQFLRILIIAPTIVIVNWQNEFSKWIPAPLRQAAFGMQSAIILRNTGSTANWSRRIQAIREWNERGGILILGYEMFRDLVYVEDSTDASVEYNPPSLSTNDTSDIPDLLENPNLSIRRKKAQEARALVCDAAHIVVCDEAHRVKNPTSALHKAVKLVQTPHRICLTGYPLQNNLREYWCMIDFSRPQFLPCWEDMRGRFVRPIKRGLDPKATEHDVRYAQQKLYVLSKLVEPIVFRLDAQILHEALPPKREFVLRCRLSALQARMYHSFITTAGRGIRDLFAKSAVLTRILNHPGVLSLLYSGRHPEDRDISDIECPVDPEYPTEQIVSKDSEKRIRQVARSWSTQFLEEEGEGMMDLRHSGKMVLAVKLVELARQQGEKTLLFSRSLCSLDYVELALTGRGIRSVRIDGTVCMADRCQRIADFERAESGLDVFLISAHTGSVGINLTAASRVIILDVGWNPCHDEQAIGRVFRWGQRRPVYVYRLYGFGSMEARLYQLNVEKITLSLQAVDRKMVDVRRRKEILDNFFAPLKEEDPDEVHNMNEYFAKDEQVLGQLIKDYDSLLVDVFDHHEQLEERLNAKFNQREQESLDKEVQLHRRGQEYRQKGIPFALDDVGFIEEHPRGKSNRPWWFNEGRHEAPKSPINIGLEGVQLEESEDEQDSDADYFFDFVGDLSLPLSPVSGRGTADDPVTIVD